MSRRDVSLLWSEAASVAGLVGSHGPSSLHRFHFSAAKSRGLAGEKAEVRARHVKIPLISIGGFNKRLHQFHEGKGQSLFVELAAVKSALGKQGEGRCFKVGCILCTSPQRSTGPPTLWELLYARVAKA